MEVGRQRALVRVSVTARKQKEKDGASTSAPNIVSKGTSKRKSEGKDDCPLKKRLGTLVGNKQPSPLKPSYGVGKGLMMGKGLVAQGVVRHLLTHKEHAIEVVKSIIKETDLDPCAE